MSSPLDAPLAASFRTFLYRVGDIERQIQRALADTRPEFQPPTAESLRLRLQEELAELAAEAQSRGQHPSSAPFQQAYHLMASVADATLQNLEWWGRNRWLEKPLVTDYALPDGVPEGLTQQLDQLLAAPQPDLGLTQVYLHALATGTWHDLDTASYRQRLFRVLSDAHPGLARPTDRLFPSAYRRHQKHGAVAYLPATRRWLAAVLVVSTLLLVLSAPLWEQATAVARQTIQQLLAAGE